MYILIARRVHLIKFLNMKCICNYYKQYINKINVDFSSLLFYFVESLFVKHKQCNNYGINKFKTISFNIRKIFSII